MAFFFIAPTATFKDANGIQFVAPKYFQTDLAGMNMACVPYGLEQFILFSLASPNAALQAESDVFSFPQDLSQPLKLPDVMALDSYLLTANIPSSWIIAGMTFQEVLRQIAQIHLVAQFIAGATGKPIFQPGVTVNTAYALLPPTSGLSAASLSANVNAKSLFTFTGATAVSKVGDILVAVGQQFSVPIIIGAGESI